MKIMLLANSMDRAIGAIDETVSEALAAWRAEKDRATLLVANLELTGEQAARLAGMIGKGDVQ
jgi:hypothetical protein